MQDTNRLAEAEQYIRRALAIDEASYGPNHPSVANSLNNLAECQRATNRLDGAESLYRRALAIDAASYVRDHTAVATHVTHLALLLQATNRSDEAEPFYRRGLEIFQHFNRVTDHDVIESVAQTSGDPHIRFNSTHP